jgi:transcriptional regulator with XRE-family HTH domain
MTVINDLPFGYQLKKYRTRRNLTQAELAGLSGVSIRGIRNLEQGTVSFPRRDTIRLLSDALQLATHERVSFLLAAGSDADEAILGTMPASLAVTSHAIPEREHEVAAVTRRILTGHDRRLISINGFWGVGKTRLALAVSYEAYTRQGMPVLWTSLNTPVDDGLPSGPEQDNSGLAGSASPWAEGLISTADGETTQAAQAAQAANLVGKRTALLVIDGNDENRVRLATIWNLLRQCPNLRIIETTRRCRSALEETSFPLRPLPAHSAALSLVLDILGNACISPASGQDDLAGLQEICSNLDGIPRALEAAVAWLRIMSVSQVVAMSRTQPHVLATRPGEQCEVARVADEAVRDHSAFHQAFLARVARWTQPWTLEEAMTRLNTTREHIAGAIHCLYQGGLLQQSVAPDGVIRFIILNLLRSCLAAGDRAMKIPAEARGGSTPLPSSRLGATSEDELYGIGETCPAARRTHPAPVVLSGRAGCDHAR